MKISSWVRGTRAGVATLLIATAPLAAQQPAPTPAPTAQTSPLTPAPAAQVPPARESGPAGSVVSAQPGPRGDVTMPAPQADGIHISLNDAIRIALSNNQDLNVSLNAAEATQFTLFENLGIYDPLITANSTRAHNETPTSTALAGAEVLRQDTVDAALGISQLTPWGGTATFGLVGNRSLTNSSFSNTNPSLTANLNLGISQPLLRNFGTRPTNIRIDTSRNTRDAAYQTFIRSVQTTIDTVEQAYWDLVYARANLQVKREAVGIATELNRITRIKIDVGSLAPIDIVQTEVGIATAEQDVINAEGVLGVAEDQLRRTLNFEASTTSSTTIIPTDEIRVERQPYDLPAGITNALEHRPEIVAQNYTVANNQLLYEYWDNQLLPQLDLVAGYGKAGLSGKVLAVDPATGRPLQPPQVIENTNWFNAADQLFSENFKNWRVGFVFSYPLFNRSARGARGVAEFNLETEKANLTVLEQNVVQNVRNAHRAIETASRQIDAAAKGRELAERNLDAARKKYDNGMTTSFEVSQIQVQLSDAQSRELNALSIYRKAVSAYHSAIADILEWKGVRIDSIPAADPGLGGPSTQVVQDRSTHSGTATAR
jgi:outer membrane protein TolC